MVECIFCQIIQGVQPAFVIAEDAETLAFVSLENHPLVVPRRHVEALYDLDEATGGALMRATVRVARALQRGLACDGVYLTQANGRAAGQDVFHVHVHLYPRWESPTPAGGWRPTANDAERRRTAAQVRAAVHGA
jgi:histidine triad (HIT) family protein